jgi:hypothetical protein
VPYQDLLIEITQEFTYSFGGATLLRGLDGNYLAKNGDKIRDRVNLVWTDTHLPFEEKFEAISRYVDELYLSIMAALEEESVLIVALPVYHAE